MGRGKSVSGICDGCQINFTCIQHCRNAVLIAVRAWPCSPLRSFSLIRKTELWRTNKPPALRVVGIALALCKKPPLI